MKISGSIITLFLTFSQTSLFAYFNVQASEETAAVRSRGDAADDPAIWRHPIKPEKSLIFGTDKKKGLIIYNLEGNVIQTLSGTKYNNVDIGYDYELNGEVVDLAFASIKLRKYFHVLKIDKETGIVSFYKKIDSGIRGYGICIGQDQNNHTTAVVTGYKNKARSILLSVQKNKLKAIGYQTLNISGKNEGCAVDTANEAIYIAEEEKGIWKFPLKGSRTGKLVASIAQNKHLAADLEGLTIFDCNQKSGYLIASVQSKNQFALFNRENMEYVTSFKIQESDNIDRVTYTDGIAVAPGNFGPNFPAGIFIAQDNYNLSHGKIRQNFKMVSWETIFAEADKQLCSVENS